MKQVKKLSQCPLWNQALDDELLRKRSRENPLFLPLIKRLGEDEAFFDAFSRLKLKTSSQVLVLIEACFQAHKLALDFRRRIAEVDKALERFKRLDEGIADLTAFISEQEKGDSFSVAWRDVRTMDGHIFRKTRLIEFRRMKVGISLLASLVRGQRYMEETTPAVIGATRKKRLERIAPVNGGILFLGKVVKRLTGRPHAREVADLGEALFGVEITKDRVNGVLKKKRGRRKTVVHSPRKKPTNAP